MLRNRFGRTELQMPALSCGGMRYQKSWKSDDPIDEENQRNLEDTIRRALDVGINHIETARGYGTSELQLGRVLPKLPREDFILQTKCVPKYNPIEFRAEVEKSLLLLGVDHIDLLGIHGINHDESATRTFECGTLEVAEEMRKEGKVRFIGFSTHGATQTIVDAIETGKLDYVNLHYYYFNQNNWRAVEAAERHDMGLFIISPSDKGGKLYEPTPKLIELCRPLTPMQFNDLWTLRSGKVHTLSIGAARPSDFDEHLAAFEFWDEKEPLLDEIHLRIDAEMRSVLGGDWVDDWQKNLPEWWDTPGEINLPVVLQLWNLAKALDMTAFGQMRYNLLGNADIWFPGNKADKLTGGEVSEEQLREVLSKHSMPDRVIEALREVGDLIGGEEVQRLSAS